MSVHHIQSKITDGGCPTCEDQGFIWDDEGGIPIELPCPTCPEGTKWQRRLGVKVDKMIAEGTLKG